MFELLPSNNPIELNTPFPLINAVSANLQDGEIFKVKKSEDLFYLIHKAGFSYLIKNHQIELSDIFLFLLRSEKIPVYFHIYDPPSELISLCKVSTDKINIKIRRRIQLNFSNRKINLEKLDLPKNYKIQMINADNFKKLYVFNLSLDNKFWRSEEDFRKNGFGFCVFNEAGFPVSICYTACIVNNTAEIDVATLPEYQKRGFAKLVVTAFVEFCFENSITANWDCFEDNYGSLRTAERIGFTYLMAYNFLSIFKKEKNYETY